MLQAVVMFSKYQSTYHRSQALSYTYATPPIPTKKSWWVISGLNFFLLAQAVLVIIAISSPKTLASLQTWPWLTHNVAKLNPSQGLENPDIISSTINQDTAVEPFLRKPAPTPAAITRASSPVHNVTYVIGDRPKIGFGFILPLAYAGISQGFSHGHTGIDLRAPIGTPINAAGAGRVIEAKTSGWNGGWGKTILIDNGNGITTRYAHLSELYVTIGATVTPNQVIAKSGATGRATGPHLHFEVRFNGIPQNPLR